MAAQMRAKMRVSGLGESTHSTQLQLTAVCKSDGYPADGLDENNTFAKWTPMAQLSMTINNPDLFGKFAIGQEFYVDFTPVVPA